MAENPEIIIVRKKAHNRQRHGGAWKVAYADFVTAMMALFIVLWLMGTSKQVQDAVGGYFRDPSGTAAMAGTNRNGVAQNLALRKQDMQKLKEDILRSIHHLDPLDKLKGHIEITITAEGLRIELMESSRGTFFELGSAQPTPALREVLAVLAPELGKLPNLISIEGHTDSKPYPKHGAYDNWDLSTDRANEARRLMQSEGVRADQISQVRGFASERPRLPLHPEDPSNRRISLIVQYQVEKGSEVPIPGFSPGTQPRPEAQAGAQSKAMAAKGPAPTPAKSPAATPAKSSAAIPLTQAAPRPGKTAASTRPGQ